MHKPDRTFMKKLKALDKRLGIHFSNEQGKFVVTYARGYGTVNLFTVKTPEGGFREPDDRDIDVLNKGDMKNDTVKDKMDRVCRHMEDHGAKQKKDNKDNLRGLTKDNRNQLMKVFARAAGSGKNNSAFRRITVKPKGLPLPA